ncbi:MAG: TetR/AcrR family transcriptional regulator, partial [Anaerolineaceae bacterium]|nr:TetR/AcrR family transcriptional regulator [Anaerolineaceae bacterium]
ALFSERGYDAVGIQEIVDTAGVTKPTLYHYFTNKRGLLDQLLERDFSVFNTRVREKAEYRGDLTLTLENIVREFFQYAKERPAVLRLQLSLHFAPADSESNQAVRRFNQEQYEIIEDLFRFAVREHGNMRGREQAYAATFIGMIHTYVGLYLNQYINLDEALVFQSVHQFIHGILS